MTGFVSLTTKVTINGSCHGSLWNGIPDCRSSYASVCSPLLVSFRGWGSSPYRSTSSGLSGSSSPWSCCRRRALTSSKFALTYSFSASEMRHDLILHALDLTNQSAVVFPFSAVCRFCRDFVAFPAVAGHRQFVKQWRYRQLEAFSRIHQAAARSGWYPFLQATTRTLRQTVSGSQLNAPQCPLGGHVTALSRASRRQRSRF